MKLTSQIERVFSGWDEPFLPWLARFLCQRYEGGPTLNMREATVVLPGANAMRRLLTLLVIEADRKGQALIPPRLITPGSLCDQFLPPSRDAASPGCRILAWIDALKRTDHETLRQLVADVPSENDFRSWLSLAKRIDSLHVEVSAGGLYFRDVAVRGAELPAFLDEDRWQVLDEIAARYQETLARQGKIDPYFDRLERLSGVEMPCDGGDFYLAGTVDLSKNARDLLQRLTGTITVVIFAPAERSDYFDLWGGVIPSKWETACAPLSNEQMTVVDAPKDAVAQMYRDLSQLSADYALNDISIGIGNESEISYFKGMLTELGVPVRAAGGRAFSQSSFGILLRAISSYLNSGAYQHFCQLVRHPAIVRMLQDARISEKLPPKDPGEIIDRYQERHLQAVITAQMPLESSVDHDTRQILTVLEGLFARLQGPPILASAWVNEISHFVSAISPYLAPEEFSAAEGFVEVVASLAGTRAALKLKGSEILLLTAQLAEEALTFPDEQQHAIELLGWLELTHDDAPVSILTGIDEGSVPAAINSDSFLPNALRSHLGLADNASRFARDLYILSALIETRPICTIVVTRRTLDASPRFPSRLLMAATGNELADRIAHLLHDGSRLQLNRTAVNGDIERFTVQEPRVKKGLVSVMSVTSFKDYLECPYRYYLKHVLKAEPSRSNEVEMNALLFGTLAHGVLYQAWKEQSLARTSADALFSELEEILNIKVKKQFGAHEFPAIRVQIEQLRERLRRFSYWQAVRNREGWRIVDAERQIGEDDCPIDLDEGVMKVVGRIDRIDVHEKSGRYQIIDYKTGDNQKTLSHVLSKPRQKKGEPKLEYWTDLQIPLYLRATKILYPESEGVTGFLYVNLSANSFDEIVTDAEALLGSVEKGVLSAREVARNVRDGVFWPPAEKVSNDAYDWMLGLREEEEDQIEEGEYE